MEVKLTTGLKVGDKPQITAILRQLTTGDLIDANKESEKVIATPTGYTLLTSNAELGVNILRRQIVKIGEIEGPITLETFRKLSTEDFEILQQAAENLDEAILAKAKERGRDKDTATGSASGISNAQDVS